MSKYVCGIMLLAAMCSLSSCSFRLTGKKRVQKPGMAITDTTGTAAGGHALLPLPDTVAALADTTGQVMQQIANVMPLWNRHYEYKTFSGKAKINFKGPEDSHEFTAIFRIRKDSVIWITISGLGGMVPVARLLVTTDSFYMMNYLQKEAMRLPLSEIAKILPAPVDFTSLQSLLTGDRLHNGTITHAAASSGTWAIQAEDSNYIQHIVYNKADSTMRTSRLLTRATGGPQAQVQYDAYDTANGRRVANSRIINVQNGPDQYILNMDFINIAFDQPLDFPFSIPKSYKMK